MSFSLPDVTAPAPARQGPVVEWEETDCPLCRSGHWSPLVEAPDAAAGAGGLWFLVVQCRECGLCFTNPRPSRGTIAQFYPADYPPHRLPEDRPPRPGWRRLVPWPGGRRRTRRALKVFGQGRLLDFGCGGGSYLLRMRRRGWQVTGLDSSAAVVQRVRAELGLQALAGSLPHPALLPGRFDLVTMWEALEHAHNPLEILQEAHRLLAPGGKLVVAVPNIDSLPFRWFGPAWYGLDLPRHLTHFAPWTLFLMLHRAGFRVGPVRMVRHSSWLRASARLACRTPLATRWHHFLTRKTPSRLATWYGFLTQQSDSMMIVAER